MGGKREKGEQRERRERVKGGFLRDNAFPDRQDGKEWPSTVKPR